MLLALTLNNLFYKVVNGHERVQGEGQIGRESYDCSKEEISPNYTTNEVAATGDGKQNRYGEPGN